MSLVFEVLFWHFFSAQEGNETGNGLYLFRLPRASVKRGSECTNEKKVVTEWQGHGSIDVVDDQQETLLLFIGTARGQPAAGDVE